jgi:hypothetical protein
MQCTASSSCAHTHKPALESSCFNECFIFATAGNGRISRFCGISLSLSLSEVNTLTRHANETSTSGVHSSVCFFLFLKSLVGYKIFQRRNVPTESIKARCAQAIGLYLFFLFLLWSSCSSSSSSLLHQGIPPAPVAEAGGYLWTCDAFTGLLKRVRSFVRSFVATSGFRGLFCSRWHHQSFLWFQNSSSCCKHLLLLLLAYFW